MPQERNAAFLTAMVSCALATGMIGTAESGLAATQDIADSQINLAVERSLFANDHVPADQIDPSTIDGIVTLTGVVPNLLAKEKAVRQAQMVKGVRAVVDRIEVRPIRITDTELSKDVSRALLIDPATDSYDIRVTAAEGTVTLSGTVDSWVERQLAGTVAKGVRGVKGVTNDIQVKAPGTIRADAEIEAEIERRFDNDVWFTGTRLDTKVEDGIVTLSGDVGSALQKSRAEFRAYIMGVKSVRNDINVDWRLRRNLQRTEYPDRTDEEIARAVENALLYDPRVWSFNPHVSVSDGIVTLTGLVDNLKAKRAAERDARYTVGVKRVKNYLKVRPKDQPSDEHIGDRVRSALAIDPLVDRYDISTVVRNGTVYLYGTVDNYAEKWRADDLASRVSGVTVVMNRLVVQDTLTGARDWEIKTDIEDELWWSPFVDEEQVQVSVKDGVATLTGTVESWWERERATENAFEGGARHVRNKLLVVNR